MNRFRLALCIIPLTLLTACGDDQQLIPVGTKLPHGYTVDESISAVSMEECVKLAASKRTEMRSSSFHETNDGHTYTAVATFADGSDILQLCKKRKDNSANYASARKK